MVLWILQQMFVHMLRTIKAAPVSEQVHRAQDLNLRKTQGCKRIIDSSECV